METIKCSKCGCEMSVMSEACPLCGTPTRIVKSVAVKQPKPTKAEKVTRPNINNQTRVKTLEEALIMAMNYVKVTPDTILYVKPREGGEFSSFLDMNNFLWVGDMMICNHPKINFDHCDLETSVEYLNSEEDCKKFAEDFSSFCKANGFNTNDYTYCFDAVLVYDCMSDSNLALEVETELYVKEDIAEIASQIDAFNAKTLSVGLSTLSYKGSQPSITGMIKFSAAKGMFKKGAEKKVRSELIKNLSDLVCEIAEKYQI